MGLLSNLQGYASDAWIVIRCYCFKFHWDQKVVPLNNFQFSSSQGFHHWTISNESSLLNAGTARCQLEQNFCHVLMCNRSSLANGGFQEAEVTEMPGLFNSLYSNHESSPQTLIGLEIMVWKQNKCFSNCSIFASFLR